MAVRLARPINSFAVSLLASRLSFPACSKDCFAFELFGFSRSILSSYEVWESSPFTRDLAESASWLMPSTLSASDVT